MSGGVKATLGRAGRLARIAASGAGLWAGLGIYALVLALNFAGVWVSLRLIAWNKAFYDALENLDGATALRQVGLFFLLTALSAGAWLAADWLRKLLLIRWRARLTQVALDLWIGNRAYWVMRAGYSDQPVENPDQRISEDCRLFVDNLLTFTLDLISTLVGLFSFVAALWVAADFALSFTAFGTDISIPRYMVWLAPVYVVISTALTHGLGRPLKRVYFDRERVEADFRHALVRVRDQADTIAQSAGERAEARRLDQRFGAILRNWRQVMRAELVLGLFMRPYMQTVLRIPTFLALPIYFAGAVTLGGLMQIASAFSNVVTELSWFIFKYRDLAGFVAVCERLDGLLAQSRTPAPAGGALQAIERHASPCDALRTRGLRLATPQGRWLDPLPDTQIHPGQTILVEGASGTGKTTFLSALTGLWNWGQGRIEEPGGRTLVLPAGAPVMDEDILAAASYPEHPDIHGLPRILAVLDRVGLGHRVGSKCGTCGLSMGERQRLGLARAVLNRPDWLILDEATAALDCEAEADLLRWLRRELPAAAIIIVAHRPPPAIEPDHILAIGTIEPEATEPERKTA